MKSKIDEVWEKLKNWEYQNEEIDVFESGNYFTIAKYEFERAVEEILEYLRPYVELGELTYLYETTTDTRQRPDLLQKLYNLIDKIKEQRDV